MGRRNKAGFGLRQTLCVIVVLLFCIAASSCSKNKERAEDKTRSSAQTYALAPDFRLQDLKGRNVSLSDYRGKVVLLEFWATWCPPCRATIPELVAIQKKFEGRDFVVLGVSVDDESAGLRRELTNFSRRYHINYTVLMGSEAVERNYKIWSIPRSFLIDKKGRIRDSFSGYIDQYEKEVSADVEKLL